MPLSRNEKILFHVNKAGVGVEIGPSHASVASKRDGYNVHIIDHLNQEQLIEKYRNFKINVENIEEVDYIWTGESYRDLTGKKKYYDWIIASHVIEHTPDIIKFINDCDEILNEHGVLSLVIPDARYCFDHFRPLTGLSRVIDAHYFKCRIHTPGTAAEFNLNIVSKGGEIAWSSEDPRGEYACLYGIDDARKAMEKIQKDNEYIDYHAWCFTPHLFRLIIQDLYNLEYIALKEAVFFPTAGSEFYMTLTRQGNDPEIGRLAMLQLIEAEMRDSWGHQASVRQRIRRFLGGIKHQIRRVIG